MDNDCRNFGSDLNFGFQDIDPMLAIVLCDILANILSSDMPTNVANSFGNWLQIIAQSITSFNAQQNYFQSGPGRCYNPIFRNVSNPFCSNTDICQNDFSDKRNHKKADKENSDKEIKLLRKEIKDLRMQIEILRNEINSLR